MATWAQYRPFLTSFSALSGLSLAEFFAVTPAFGDGCNKTDNEKIFDYLP
jgi:hypothetical protein